MLLPFGQIFGGAERGDLGQRYERVWLRTAKPLEAGSNDEVSTTPV
jgi:hypothetical protein